MSPVGARHWVCLEGMKRRVDPAWRGVGPWEELRAQREDETSICWCCCGAVGVVAVETLWGGFCLPPPTSHNKQRVCVLGALGRQQMEMDFLCWGDGNMSSELESSLQSSNAFPSHRSGIGRHNLPWTLVGAAGFHSSRRFFWGATFGRHQPCVCLFGVARGLCACLGNQGGTCVVNGECGRLING